VLADIRAIQKNVQLAISTLLGRKVNRQRACYELAVTSSLSWREIGEKVGLSTSGARKAAVTYATRNKLVAVPQRRADTPRSTPALH
jgi:hypothetical protein